MRIGRPAKLTLLTLAVAVFAVACTTGADSQSTATPIRSASVELERSAGVFPISDDTLLWVTGESEVLIQAQDIAQAHPFILRGQDVAFTDANATGPGVVVGDDESVVAIPVETAAGRRGVALVRNDGYEMALHMYGDSSVSIGSIKFMPEVGLTLMSLSGEEGSRLIAFNNYGMKQFDLPVTAATGTLRYSPDELGYMVIDRRPATEELELVPLAEPGESTLFRPSNSSEEEDDLYRSLSAAVASWR